jgi:hypothetical protein
MGSYLRCSVCDTRCSEWYPTKKFTQRQVKQKQELGEIDVWHVSQKQFAYIECPTKHTKSTNTHMLQGNHTAATSQWIDVSWMVGMMTLEASHPPPAVAFAASVCGLRKPAQSACCLRKLSLRVMEWTEKLEWRGIKASTQETNCCGNATWQLSIDSVYMLAILTG